MAHDRARPLVADDVPADLAPDLLELRDLRLELACAAVEALDPALHALELPLELEDLLDTREVEAELRRHLLDAAQALDVVLRVQARALRRALGLDEAARLVHAQRLRMHL